LPNAYQLVTQATTRSAQAQVLVDGVMMGQAANLTGRLGYRILYVTRLTKNITRVMEKVALERKRHPRKTLQEIVEDATSDLAGGRFLVIGTDHINTVLGAVQQLIAGQPTWGLAQKHDDYVEKPKDRTRGWRAVVQDVTVPIGGVPTQFQLQVMTYLQHAWDQLDHTFYEQERAGRALPRGATGRLRKLSDGLHCHDGEMANARKSLMNSLFAGAAGRGRRRRPAAPQRSRAKKAARKA